MASYNELNALIDAYINRNGVQAITGQILNGVLKAMVEQLGRGYTIMGATTPTTDPGTPDGPECYFASETGTYTDFDGLQIVPGELALLCYTPTDGWTKNTIYEGFQEVQATIDGNVGTPSVGVSYANGVLSFDFHNMKGNPGQNGQDGQDGDPAGFGTIGADITGGVGTPGVTVESSGPATAKNLRFHFTNLKGETGVTSVVATVDNTSGTPACTVSLVGQQLTLAFSGLKGAQGNTGSSVDYPFTIVNNLTTDDATQALSAAQGVVLQGEITQTVYVDIDESSPYYEDVLTNAYMPPTTAYPNGHIERNQYTGSYSIVLYRLPAGTYRATYNKTINRGVIVGVIANVSDFAVDGVLSRKIVDFNSETESVFSLSEETLIVLLRYGTNLCVLAKQEKENKVDILEQRVESLEEEVDGAFKKDLDIVIPDVVYAIVGTELNIFNDAVSLSIDRGLHSPLNYQIRWSCNKGTITDRCFRFTPASGDVGNVSCTCYLYDMRGVLVGSKTFTIKVLAKNALASAKNIVYFGDSLGPSAATALYDNFHDSNRFGGTIPKMLGTKGTTKNYEAVGGYRWSHYATAGADGYRISVSGVTSMAVGAVYSDGSHNFEVYEVNITEGVGNCLLGRHFTNPGTLIMPSGTLTKVSGGGDASVPYTDAFQESVNPLWNDTTQELDINQYKQTLVSLGQLSSVSDKIDAVSFQFGINDNTLANDLNTLRGYISDLYDLFVGDNADCKFIVGLTTSSGNDVNGSGANYGATFDWKAYLKNTYIIRKFYLSLLTDFPNMRIATPNLSLDRYYGYALGTRQVSDRCTETEQYHTNYVHPGTSGYEQMADAYLACYVGVLTES